MQSLGKKYSKHFTKIVRPAQAKKYIAARSIKTLGTLAIDRTDIKNENVAVP